MNHTSSLAPRICRTGQACHSFVALSRVGTIGLDAAHSPPHLETERFRSGLVWSGRRGGGVGSSRFVERPGNRQEKLRVSTPSPAPAWPARSIV